MAKLAERRKELVAALMRDGVYEAAIELLAEHGVDGLTMDRLADSAGVAKGSLYSLFRSKRGMVQFIHDKAVEPFMTAMKETIATPRTAPEKLEAILRMWFEHFAAKRGVFDFLFNDPRSRDVVEASKPTARAEAVENLEMIFEQGAAEGSFRPLDAGRTAEMFVGAVSFIIEEQLMRKEDRPADESVGSVMNLFLEGLAPRAQA